MGGAGNPPSLDALRGNPQIDGFRQLISQNPALLQPMIQQLAQGNPQLAQALASNPEALLGLLGDMTGDDGEPIPPGAQVVNVTPEERAAIERVRHILISSVSDPDTSYL